MNFHSNCKNTWNIVAGHHPVFSATSSRGNSGVLMQDLLPILEEYVCGDLLVTSVRKLICT